MGFLADFKAFALRGNVIDIAVGIVVGTAFTKIVNSLVTDLLMPPLAQLTGKVDFRQKFFALDGGAYPNLQSAVDAKAAVLTWGNFLQATVDFILIALAVFFVVRLMSRLTPKPVAVPAAPTLKECSECKSQIPLAARRCSQCTAVVA